jgi:beta-phosphoglucomutase family hydrolase
LIRAVIFDLDGVIVESENAHIEAEKQTLQRYGVQISADELHEYTGTTAQVMFTELIRKYKLKTTFEEMFQQKEKTFFKLLEKDAEPTKGIITLLRELKSKRIKLAIGSSSTKKQINYVLNKLKIEDLFDSVIGAEDITRSKPDPEIFLKAAKELQAEPRECLVVEDSKLGVEAAKRAHMKCLGYRNPDSGNQDLSKADMITDDFSKLNVATLLYRKTYHILSP